MIDKYSTREQMESPDIIYTSYEMIQAFKELLGSSTVNKVQRKLKLYRDVEERLNDKKSWKL